jgi:hypothetical protein
MATYEAAVAAVRKYAMKTPKPDHDAETPPKASTQLALAGRDEASDLDGPDVSDQARAPHEAQERSESKLTPGVVQHLLRTHLPEILAQLGYEEIEIGIPVGDPDPHIRVSVTPDRVRAMPRFVTVRTEDGPIDIPIKVVGDYEAYELQSRA